jgi:hypothetical protein
MPGGLRETTKGHNKDNRSPNRDTNTTDFVHDTERPTYGR